MKKEREKTKNKDLVRVPGWNLANIYTFVIKQTLTNDTAYTKNFQTVRKHRFKKQHVKKAA